MNFVDLNLAYPDQFQINNVLESKSDNCCQSRDHIKECKNCQMKLEKLISNELDSRKNVSHPDKKEKKYFNFNLSLEMIIILFIVISLFLYGLFIHC